MIRILTVVAFLALLAGGSLGFFVANARDKADVEAPACVDPVLDRKVEQYQQHYGLSAREASEVRAALKDYDQKLSDLLRRLRQLNTKDFKALADEADARVQAVISAHR